MILRTLSTLRERFPKIVGPRKDDICYATTNRQEAVRALAEQADVVLVVGSKTLRTPIAWLNWRSGWGKRPILSTMPPDIQEQWVKSAACVGVTAGASAPDIWCRM